MPNVLHTGAHRAHYTTDDIEDTDMSTLRQTISNAVKASGGSADRATIKAATDLDDTQLSNALFQMRGRELLREGDTPKDFIYTINPDFTPTRVRKDAPAAAAPRQPTRDLAKVKKNAKAKKQRAARKPAKKPARSTVEKIKGEMSAASRAVIRALDEERAQRERDRPEHIQTTIVAVRERIATLQMTLATLESP